MWRVLLAVILILTSVVTTHAVEIAYSELPTTISDADFTLVATVSGANNGTNYLRVDLYLDGTANYFGETDNGSYWYGGSDGKQYTPVTIASNSATITLRARLGDPSPTEYPGPGTYKLRIRRYTSSGNQASNDIQTPTTVNITKTWPSPSPSPTPTPSPTSTPTPIPTPIPTLIPTPTPTPTPSPKISPSPNFSASVGTVAGEVSIDLSTFGVSPSPTTTSPSPNQPTLNRSRVHLALFVGFGLCLISLAGFFGLRLYQRQHIIEE